VTRAGAPPFEFTLSDAARAYHDEAVLLRPEARDTTLDLTAFVSCYNEAELIVQTLDDVRAALGQVGLSFEIIVVDDCSSDDSAERVGKYIAEHPGDRIILRRNLVNQGLAQNFIDAAFLGKGRYYKLFCGDNTEPRESIVKICGLAGQADIIIPSYSTVEGKHGFRQWLSKTYTRLVNLVSGNHVGYYNGLHVHRRYNIMRWHPNTRGFGFQADIICMLLEHGATYLEVSVPAINRVASRALTWRNILSVGHTLVDILIRRLARGVYGR
jgi:glycosyltransferase involved in cell wall biosynthesis